MTLRTLEVPIGLQLVGGVRYGNGARSIILNVMLAMMGDGFAPFPGIAACTGRFCRHAAIRGARAAVR